MDNKNINITVELNTTILLITMGICLLLAFLIFCSCYNLPIVKKLRNVVKHELIEGFSAETHEEPHKSKIHNFIKAPHDFIKDIKDVINNNPPKKNTEEKETEKVPSTKNKKKDIVEGFFTNYDMN